MIFAPFTPVDAELILRESEGRPNAAGSGRGHAGERHVKIVNGLLMHRMTSSLPPKGGIPIFTAFCTFAEQVAALHEALASPELAPGLNALFRKGGSFSRTFARAHAFQIRVATGGGVITRWDRLIHLAVERQPGAYRQLHLITLFPVFEEGTLGRDGP